MTWKFENQGPLKDWPSVIDASGQLIARTYGPNAEEHARQITELQNTARAMLAALKAIQFATASPASGFGKKDAMMRACQFAEREARVAIAQAQAAGITAE